LTGFRFPPKTEPSLKVWFTSKERVAELKRTFLKPAQAAPFERVFSRRRKACGD
jgi:hypothetical protein